jgi:hypothetical protein
MNVVETMMKQVTELYSAELNLACESYKQNAANATPAQRPALVKTLLVEGLPKAAAKAQQGIEKMLRDIYNSKIKNAKPEEQSALAEEFVKDLTAFRAEMAKIKS